MDERTYYSYEWDEIEHARQNLNRNIVLLHAHAGTIERRDALRNIEMQMEIVAVAIDEAKGLFEDG
jgi:hypothetical protein